MRQARRLLPIHLKTLRCTKNSVEVAGDPANCLHYLLGAELDGRHGHACLLGQFQQNVGLVSAALDA